MNSSDKDADTSDDYRVVVGDADAVVPLPKHFVGVNAGMGSKEPISTMFVCQYFSMPTRKPIVRTNIELVYRVGDRDKVSGHNIRLVRTPLVT